MFEKIKSIFTKAQHKKGNSHITILVVEDNELDQKLITSILIRHGYNVVTAGNGQIGLDKVKTQKPNAIILDCEMPVMGGLEMCKRLKEQNETVDIPIAFLTSLNTPKNILDCFELDAENYLSKPVNAKILISQVEALLNEGSSKK